MIDISPSYHMVDLSSISFCWHIFFISYGWQISCVCVSFYTDRIWCTCGSPGSFAVYKKGFCLAMCLLKIRQHTLHVNQGMCFFHLDKSAGSVFMCRVEPLDRRDHTAVVYLAVEENLHWSRFILSAFSVWAAAVEFVISVQNGSNGSDVKTDRFRIPVLRKGWWWKRKLWQKWKILRCWDAIFYRSVF